jgi:hypothetical protein
MWSSPAILEDGCAPCNPIHVARLQSEWAWLFDRVWQDGRIIVAAHPQAPS